MRQLFPEQLSFSEPAVPHPHARELETIDRILKENPAISELIWQDLRRDLRRPDEGRPGLTAEQVLRAAVVKQMNSFSYEELTFHLMDSRSYRAFCGIGSLEEEGLRKSTLQRNIKRIREETWQAINRVLLGYAAETGVEKGRKVRIDATVTETNIHRPSDSSLLWDSVRVLTRLLTTAREHFPIDFGDRTKRAKRRALGILNAKNARQRQERYRDLLKVSRETVRAAQAALPVLRSAASLSVRALELEAVISHYVGLAERVIEQTERRVLRGESVPAAEKIVSIFEDHTDVIVKDRRETYYGHKLVLTGGRSGLILDWVVEEGNPADTSLAVGMIQRQKALYGRVPRQAALDGGFAAKENLRTIKELGVQDVAFSKKRGLDVLEMAKSTWVYKRLRDFRAGIEGWISFLKRCFGLGRCTWRGAEGFASYVGASMVTANLLTLARHALA